MDEVAKTYSDFAWIGPCEFVGGTIFTRWGGFAYRRAVAQDNSRRTGVYYPVYTNEKPEEYVGDTDGVAVAEALIKLRDSEGRRRDVIPLKCDGRIHMPAAVLQQPQALRGSDFAEFDGTGGQTPLGSSVNFWKVSIYWLESTCTRALTFENVSADAGLERPQPGQNRVCRQGEEGGGIDVVDGS